MAKSIGLLLYKTQTKMKMRRAITMCELNKVLKIKPPLVFREEDADTLVSVLDRVLSEDFQSGRE